MEQVKIGKVYAKDHVIPVQPIGSVEDDQGKLPKFVIGMREGDYAPCVVDLDTGQTFVLPWEAILQLAANAGLGAAETVEPEASKIILLG